VAQRLTRRLFEDSRRPIKPADRIREIMAQELQAIPNAGRDGSVPAKIGEIYEGEVSSACPKGTRGRIGLFELFEMTPELEEIILAGPSESKIQAEARRQGMVTMKQDVVLKVLDGVIGMGELLEVV
jgi:type II secretory ATPase GspE/PulE/Tfp pilus assembly ATPase PilB-like protein